MGTTSTSRSNRNSQNSTRSVACPPSWCESSSSDDDSRTTMGNDDQDNNSSFSESEDLPIIRSPDNEYFDYQIPGLKAEFDSLVKRLGSKWKGVESVSSLNHCYGQQEVQRIMMANGNAVMEALRDLDSQHCRVFEDENIDFTKMLKDDKHALHHPATSSVKQALTKLVTEGKKNLTLFEPTMGTIYKAAIPIFEQHIKDYNFKLDPNRNNILPNKLTSGGNDRINKILQHMRHYLIKDCLKEEIHDLQQKINKLQLENMDLKRHLDKANQENANLQVGLQRAEANSKAHSDKATITESSHDFVTPLKSKDTNIKNENQSLRQRIAELEDLRDGVATSLASKNVRMEQHGTFHYTIVNTPSRGDIPKTEED